MKPEKEKLLHDLLDEGRGRREATLLAGGRILRRRRWRRVALQSSAAVAVLALTTFSLLRFVPRQPPPLAAGSQPEAAQSLTDAQLLALFPNTPVGLVTLEDGRKRLIFPRPGDEERFVKRL